MHILWPSSFDKVVVNFINFLFRKWVSFQFYIFKGFKQYHHSYIRHHSVNIRVNLFNMFLIYNSDYLNK